MMLLADVVTGWQPWSDDHAETWAARAERLWAEQPGKMAELSERMSRRGWAGGPVHLGWDQLVWDGHHRIVAALDLGWQQRQIPAVFRPEPGG